MENFVIITDSSCDLTKELRERFNIEYIPGHLSMPDGRNVPQLLEWSEDYPDRKAFYAELRKGAKYTTSPANVSEIAEVFKKYAKEGKAILNLTISSALSGTFDFCTEAKNEVLKEYPNAEIYLADTKRYSALEGMVVIYAARLREEGKTAKETFDWVEANKNRFHSSGWLDDLKFVAMKGRMTNAKAFMGTLIGIKPIGENSSTGLTTIIGKAKGAKEGFRASLEYMAAQIENPEDQIILMATSDREEDTLKYKAMIEERIHPKEIVMTYVFPSCGVQVGPGLMCAYFIGKPITEDLKYETDLMTSILEKKN